MHPLKKCISVLILSCSAAFVHAQDVQMKTLPLDDMSAFKTQAGNWRIVGDVSMNPNVDVHEEQKPVAETAKKNKKNKTEAAPKVEAVTSTAGKGVLLNLNDESKNDQLITAFEHGDIELELEVMLPKGSNSGIYLQGRYEVQLLDSWGVRNPKYSDIGGIYRNWEKEPGKIYMGKAPLSNPAKAPGLWQKLKISFKAPKFDASGNKIANAIFLSVELNGVKIHDNVEVPLPTGGPIENNEKATGPLMIQGDHGPVAFRNIKYRLMKEAPFAISDVSYKIYHGKFKSVSEFTSAKPDLSGTMPALTCEVLDVENEYGVAYTGNITVPEDGSYTFNVFYTGPGTVVINNQKSIDSWGNSKVSAQLKKGSYPFEIYNYKEESWMPPRLGFYAEGSNIYPQALHTFNSFPPDENPVSSIYLNPGSETKLIRAFIDFKGDRAKRLTHTIGVGDPTGMNYVYDLKSGNVVCAWRGTFVDATPMWHDRGDGSFSPRGATQYLFMNQPLAYLPNPNDAFPTSGNEGEFRGKGYQVDEATNRPTFKYNYQDLEVDDQVYPDDNNRILTHEITIKNRGTKQGLYYKLAEGNNIVALADGSYAIDDKQYYIRVTAKAVVRDINGKKELILPVDGSSVKYSIVW
jgi:hypothetical protein